MTDNLAAQLRAMLQQNLSPERFLHVLGVEGLAVSLALRHGVDGDKTLIAALLHDLLKNHPGEQLKEIMERADPSLSPTEEDFHHPNVWHGVAAAIHGRTDLSIEDEEILEAVFYHTTGKAEAGPVTLCLYTADALEPSRNFPGVQDLRSQALSAPLKKAALLVAEMKLEKLRSRQSAIHSQSIAMRDWLTKEAQ